MTKKAKCEGACGKTFRTNKLSKNRVTGQMLCTRCNNKIGQNKFYNPSTRKPRITNYSITNHEKNVLAMKKGKQHVNILCSSLKTIGKRKRQENKYNRIKQVEDKQKKVKTNKQFLEGLK